MAVVAGSGGTAPLAHRGLRDRMAQTERRRQDERAREEQKKARDEQVNRTLRRDINRFQHELKRHNERKYAEAVPEWRDTMAEIWADRVLDEPTSAMEIMSIKYLHDNDEDARRRYGDRLDPYYLNPDGSVNEVRLAEDDFTLQVEKAFYTHGGQIPMEWFVEHSEDLDFFGSEYRDVIQKIRTQELWNAAADQATQLRTANQTARIDTAVERTGWTAARAGVEYDQWQELQRELMDESAEWSDEEKKKYMIDRQGVMGRFGNMGQDPFPNPDIESSRPAFETSFMTQRGDDLLKSRGYERTYKELQQAFGEAPTLSEAMVGTINEGFGAIGLAFGYVGSGIDFAAGALIPEALWNEHLQEAHQDFMGNAFGRTAPSTQREAAIAATQHTAERNFDMLVREMSVFPVLEMWERMPSVNPEAYNSLLLQWGGDEQAARNAFMEDVTLGEQFREQNIAEAERVQEAARVSLKELEEKDFGMGAALLDWFAVYGEGVETLATTILSGGKEILSGNFGFAIQDDFWEGVAEADTPAGVFGWEGTLTGLILNIVATELVEPLNVALGPRLGSRARQGVTTYDQALIQAGSPSAIMKLNEIADVSRALDGDAISVQTALDVTEVTGYDQTIIHASQGFTDPLLGRVPWADEPIAAMVDNVDYPIISGLIDEVDRAKAAEISADPSSWRPVELEVNPDLGTTRVVNPEQALAYQMKGVDAVPTVSRVDSNAHWSPGKVTPEAAKARFAPDGRATVDELAEIAEMDWNHPDVAAADRAVINQMDETLTASGVDEGLDAMRLDPSEAGDAPTPFEIWVNEDTGAHVLADGNHRVAALRRRGAGSHQVDVEVHVIPGDEWTGFGRSPLADEPHYRGLTEEPGLVPKVIDEGTPTRDWAGDYDASIGKELDGSVYAKPRDLIGESIYGARDMDLMKDAYARHLADGGDPLHGRQTVMAVATGQAIRQAFRQNGGKVGSWIDNYLTPHMANANLPFTGTTAMANLRQFQVRLWSTADDLGSWREWSRQLQAWKVKQASLRAQQKVLVGEARGLMDEVAGYEAWTAGKLDDGALGLKDPLNPNAAQARANHAQLNKAAEDARARYIEVTKKQRTHSGELNNFTGLHQLMDDMMDDFNRKHLATRKDLAEYIDAETGLVDIQAAVGRAPSIGDQLAAVSNRARADNIGLREAAQRELGMIPTELEQIMKLSDNASANAFLADTVHHLQGPGSYVAPASPMELAALASGGTRAARTLAQHIHWKNLGNFMHDAHMLWTMDKVFTPRTAAVVSIDELMRIWQAGGNKAFLRYMEDKVTRGVANVTRARSNPAVWDKLPKRWKDRLVKLEQYPTFFRQMERTWLELGGVGFDVIEYNKRGRNVEYHQAAQRFSGGLLNDVGFQKYLEGPDAFKQWYETDPTAAAIREQDFFDAGSGGRAQGAAWHEIYDGWDGVMNQYLLSGIKGSDKVAAYRLWKDGAAQSAAKGSTAAGPVNLPNWVLEGMQRVTGNKQVGGTFSQATNAISGALFQGPVDYRRGFLAEWVRKSEVGRLNRLFESQGRRIVSDAELTSIIHQRYPGLADEIALRNMDTVAQQLMESHGVISQRYVDKLVESKVIAEMDNMLYSFHMSSRAGRASKAVVPFGKPWADMWGYWGRELLSRPQLRGYLNNTNMLGISKAANAVADSLPFNPKVAAFGSRLAATDFSLDRIEDDPLVGGVARALGLDGMDLGSALFLPVGGENPFSVMLPGFGVVPSSLATLLVMGTAPDLAEDPVAYQQHIDKYAQLFPGIAYNQPGDLKEWISQTTLGGGATSRFGNMVSSADNMLFDAAPGPAVFSQDWKARIAANRNVKLIFQDPEIYQEFTELPPELMEAGFSVFLDEKLAEIAEEGSYQAGKQGLMENVGEFAFPARLDFSVENDMLAEAWVDNAVGLGFEIPDRFDQTTEMGKLEAADWVRGEFYDMPDWERDSAVAESPGLAVNMVSMWEWSQKAEDLGTPGSGVPYRTGGSMRDLNRHEALVRQGMIQPVSPRDMATRIAGVVLSARTQTARNLYVEASNTINDQRWEHLVPEEVQTWFNEMAVWAEENDALPYRTGRELWENYNDLKNYYDQWYPADEDGEGGFSVPTKYRAWGASMPSSREAVPERLDIAENQPEGYPLPMLTPEMARMAGALGIEMRAGMGMPEVYQQVADALSDNYTENPIFAHIGPEYQAYISPRGAGHRAALATLNTVIDHRDFAPETVAGYQKTLVWLEETVARKAMDDNSWLDMREETVAMYNRMAQDDAFGKLDMKKLWNDAYGRTLGELDWEPDEPPPLRMEDGGYNPEATQIFVNRVIDGDTIEVEYRRMTPSLFEPAMQTYRIRMLGTNQPEVGSDEGEAARTELLNNINTALAEGTPITLVRDPDRYGYADMYGRVFGWVYIGDEAVYDPDTMIPGR